MRDKNGKHYVGSYAKISPERYKRILEILDSGTFHTSQGKDYFVIKIINKKIRRAALQTRKMQ